MCHVGDSRRHGQWPAAGGLPVPGWCWRGFRVAHRTASFFFPDRLAYTQPVSVATGGGDGERSPAGIPAGGCLARKLKDPYNLELKALTFEFIKIFYVRLLICRSPSNQRWWQKPGPCGDKGRHVRSGSRPRCLPHFVRWDVARLPVWAEPCGWASVCALFPWSVVMSPSQAACAGSWEECAIFTRRPHG